jgi:hypothetical protein
MSDELKFQREVAIGMLRKQAQGYRTQRENAERELVTVRETLAIWAEESAKYGAKERAMERVIAELQEEA